MAAFFLNLTGLDFHQWLGIFLGGFALYHLALHAGWVKKVTTRFFQQTSWRMRGYYLLDAGILWGFITIITTGVVISSWLSLALANYGVWRSVHVGSSVITLAAVVIKIGLHWRWIVSTLVKAVTPPATDRQAPVPVLQPVGDGRAVSRRQFLKLMGVVGVGAMLGIGNVLLEKKTALAEAINNQSQSATDYLVDTSASSTVPVALAVVPTEVVSSAVKTDTTTLTCTQSCPRGRHCLFPGSCGRYTDSNNNGHCDLGECV